MANTSYEGTEKDPFQLDHFQQVVDFNWGGFAILQIDYPNDLQFSFSDNATHTTNSYSSGQKIIVKDVVDDDNPIIRIEFTEQNPISGSVDASGFSYELLYFREPYLWVIPHIEVIDAGDQTDNAQASWDAYVVSRNAEFQQVFDDDKGRLSIKIDNFMIAHPEGSILRDVTDIRGYTDEPEEGWGTGSIIYLPLPWVSRGGFSPSDPPAIFSKFDFPGYLTYSQPATQALPPVLVGSVFGKSPNFADQRRDRNTYLIALSKLKNKTISIRVDAKSFHLNSAVGLSWLTGGGAFTAAEKRTVTSSNEFIATTKFASGRQEDVIIAKFTKNGFAVDE